MTVLKVFPFFQVFFSSSSQEPAEDVFLTELCVRMQDSISPRGVFAPLETPQLGLHQPWPRHGHSPHTLAIRSRPEFLCLPPWHVMIGRRVVAGSWSQPGDA